MKAAGTTLFALLVAACSASSCRARKSDGVPSLADVAAPRRLLEQPRATYHPPADGLLKKVQVETYSAVLERAVKSLPAKPAEKPGDGTPSALADEDPLLAPDVAAARAMKLDEEEFLWVRERVLEAEAAEMGAKLNTDVLAMLDRTLADLRQRRATAADAGSRQLIEEQIATFEAEGARVRKEAAEPEPEQVRANVRILQPYRAKIGLLQAELDRSLAVLRQRRRRAEPTPGR